MSQPFDAQEFLGRLMRNEVNEAELMKLVTAGHALVERRKDAARRRAIEINTELTGLRERLEMLRRDYGSLIDTPASVVIELAQINFKTQVRVTELNRILTLVPGLHDEVLNDLVHRYEASDAEKASAAEPTEAPTHIHLPDDADPSAVAEAVASALSDEAKQ